MARTDLLLGPRVCNKSYQTPRTKKLKNILRYFFRNLAVSWLVLFFITLTTTLMGYDEKVITVFTLIAFSMCFVVQYVASEKKLYTESGSIPIFHKNDANQAWKSIFFPLVIFALITSILAIGEKISFRSDLKIIQINSLLLIFSVAALEEVFFRGYLLAALRKLVRIEYAMLFSSVIFTLCHIYNDTTTLTYIFHFMFGLSMAAISVKYKSLLFSIIFHSVSNYSLGVSSSYFSSLFNSDGLFQLTNRASSEFYMQLCLTVFVLLIIFSLKDIHWMKHKDKSRKEMNS